MNQGHLDELQRALHYLDTLLERAIAAAEAAYGPETAADPFRGLYITHEDAERFVARESNAWPNWLPSPNGAVPGGQESSLARLATWFDLASLDVNILLVALAPELDLRYERIYAYLQDDVTRRRPTVDLTLNLLCRSFEERLARRAHFDADAPLIRHGLVRLVPDPSHVQPPLLSHYLKLDQQVVRFLLGQDGLDDRLASFCRVVQPIRAIERLPLPTIVGHSLPPLVRDAHHSGRLLRLHFSGPRDSTKQRVAEALAGEIGAAVVAADLNAAPDDEGEFETAMALLSREARLRNALLFIDNVDAVLSTASRRERSLINMLESTPGIIILASEQPWRSRPCTLVDTIDLAFAIPDFDVRRAWLTAALDTARVPTDHLDLDAFTNRFQITPDQITRTVAAAQNRHRLRQADGHPSTADLFAAAREQCGHQLASLARKIDPLYLWDDIVLPPDTHAQLREICQRVVHRQRVLHGWGFNGKQSLGKGINALFAGPSGTGKTMAAEVIAHELQLDLYKIDLSQIVSKYIGETEKNLDAVFAAARNSNAILFFDEADALFGKRSEVRDAHDRYANIEISYLLQKMEEYEGVAILATNLRRNLDDGFARRLAFSITFANPEEPDRLQIWSKVWPADTPLADDLDLPFMARQFKFTGGNIRNIALSAAFLAAEDDRPIAMEHLIRATRRELRKIGKVIAESEYGEYLSVSESRHDDVEATQG